MIHQFSLLMAVAIMNSYHVSSYGFLESERAVRRDFRRTVGSNFAVCRGMPCRVVDAPLFTVWKNTIALRHPLDIANISTTIEASIAHIFRRLENRRILESTPLICLVNLCDIENQAGYRHSTSKPGWSIPPLLLHPCVLHSLHNYSCNGVASTQCEKCGMGGVRRRE